MKAGGMFATDKGYVVATDSGYVVEYVIDKEIGQVRFTIGEIDDALRLPLGEAIHLSYILSDNGFDTGVEIA